LFSLPVWANGPLRSIIIFGNEKTERSTILNMISLEPQTFVNPKLVQEVDDRLVNSGLFKTVRVTRVDNRDGTCDLRIVVVEKQLWFVFPIFQAWSGSYSGGAAFGESNLFATNARTLFAVQGGNSTSRLFGVFDAQNVFDSNFAVRTWVLARGDDVPLYDGKDEVGKIRMKDAAISVIPGYQWTTNIRTSMGFTYRYVDYGFSPRVVTSGAHGNDVALQFDFTFDSLQRREAFLRGNRIRVSYEFADTRLGTDFTYHVQEAEWVHARTYGRFVNHVFRLYGAIGDSGLPFHKDFTLGGSSLRGYSDREFRGDTEILARQDLLTPILQMKKFSVFGLVFHDLGILYRDANGISRNALHNGLGGGIRVSLKNILAPVVGADVGYGVEDRAFHAYLALGLVDF
jgi:outer membrane protein insertion porin family